MKTKILETTLCLFLMVGVMQLTAFAATDTKKTQDVSTNTETNQMLKQISDLDPDKPTLKEFVKPQNNARASTQSNLVTSDQGDFKVNIDTKNRKINLSKKGKSDISFSIPTDVDSKDIEVLGSKVVFTGKGGKYKNVVEAIDGGVRQLIYITSKDAPTTYDFPMNLASGDKVEVLADGGVMVIDSKGDMKVFILKPWAKDAKGKELKTWYTVEENTLKQHIEFKGAALPVVADPAWCGQQVSSTSWIKSNYTDGPQVNKFQNISLQTTLTYCGFETAKYATWGGAYYTYLVDQAWSEVKNRGGSNGFLILAFYGKITQSEYNAYITTLINTFVKQPTCSLSGNSCMLFSRPEFEARLYEQFRCHFINPKIIWNGTSEYHLEPWRQQVGFPSIYNSGCNPTKDSRFP